MALAGIRAPWGRGVEWVRSEPAGSAVVYGSLGSFVVCTVTLLVAVAALSPVQRALLVIGSLVSWAVLVVAGHLRGTLPLRAVVAAIAITLAFAAATPSHQSKDVYSYAMYGRIVTEHHRNPYATYPMHFEGDPMRRHVSSMWQRTPDIYGAGFTAIMVVAAPVVGESTLAARLVYQLVALAAVTGVLWLLWRRTRSAQALAFVGLHPLMAVSVVNGGHPDALIALGVLAGVLLALERRPVLAALAFVTAISVNITAVVAAPVLVVWAFRRWTRRELLTFGGIIAALGIAPYLFLSGWLTTASEHAQLVSRQSVWTIVDTFGTGLDLRSIVSHGASVVAAALVMLVLVRHARRAPDYAAGAAMAVFVMASAWVMPWYGFAALALFAMRKPNPLGFTVACYSALILVGEQFPSLSASAVGVVAHQLLQFWVPLAALVVCVAMIVRPPRDIATGEPVLATSA